MAVVVMNLSGPAENGEKISVYDLIYVPSLERQTVILYVILHFIDQLTILANVTLLPYLP
jgi:hypothetical protein